MYMYNDYVLCTSIEGLLKLNDQRKRWYSDTCKIIFMHEHSIIIASI